MSWISRVERRWPPLTNQIPRGTTPRVGNPPPPNSTDALAAALYDELRAMAAAYLTKEPDGHTLQPTALVNEALLRILGQEQGQAANAWANREQFLGVAAICMRRVLVDHARARGREKRGGGAVKLSLDEAMAVAHADGIDVLDLDEALRGRIRSALRTELSPRHAPDVIEAVPTVPRTLSGKKLEVPVKKILSGHVAESVLSTESLADPMSIEWFRRYAAQAG